MIGSFITPSEVGNTTEVNVGRIVDVCSGDEGGGDGGTAIGLMVDVELPSPMLHLSPY